MITDIIIVSYKDEAEIKRCIASIKEHCTDYNLIIEDNNIPGQNRGFSKAVNDGIQKGSGDWVWLINSDAIVKDAMTQQALIDRFSYGKQVGIVGSMQVDYDNHDLIRHCGTSRCFPAGQHKGGYISMGHGRIPEKQTWVNFASVMFSRDMIQKIGLLDESMFLLYSDSSYCYTARLNLYECWYEPRSIVYHKLNTSKTVTEWHQKDMQAFMKKWGITQTPDGRFIYSDLFARLDMFP
jgi:Predicted glycosyltransferases